MSRHHQNRLRALEAHFNGEIPGKKQLELLQDAMCGDANAADKFEELRAAGKIIPLLGNLYDLERLGPVENKKREENPIHD